MDNIIIEPLLEEKELIDSINKLDVDEYIKKILYNNTIYVNINDEKLYSTWEARNGNIYVEKYDKKKDILIMYEGDTAMKIHIQALKNMKNNLVQSIENIIKMKNIGNYLFN